MPMGDSSVCRSSAFIDSGHPIHDKGGRDYKL